MKRFIGFRNAQDNGHVVVCNETKANERAVRRRTYPLARFLHLHNHSPCGFAWGYAGSGPSQLALAILANVTRDSALALAAHQDYKSDVIARLPQDASLHEKAGTARLIGKPIEEWSIREEEVREWLKGWLEDPQNAHDVEEMREWRKAGLR